MKTKFLNFLNSTTAYEAAESYWLSMFEEYNSQLQAANQWESWFDLVWGNGTKKMDGNPIITRWNSELKKGLRVIQNEPDCKDQSDVGAWMNKFDDTVDEIIISCILTDETEVIIRRLIRAYVVDNVSPVEMQEIIDAELSRFYPDTDQ
jgi:hypothetical protein